jgi:peptidoglycan/xylan/chitin deacetylase (PgdA/CDA1 family)
MTVGVVARGSELLPVQWVRPLSGVSLVVPFYHVVTDQAVPHIAHLYRFKNVREFNQDLEFLLRHFEPIALGDVVDALNGKRPLTRTCVHLTFDDGFREVHDIIAPILQRAGVAATFFLNTAFLDGGGIAHHNALSLLIDRLESRNKPVSEATLRRLDSLLPTDKQETNIKTRILSIRHAQKSLVSSLGELLDVDFDQYVRNTRPYLSAGEIAALVKMGFSIGAHSHEHLLYENLPVPTQVEQTRTCVNLLQTQFGIKTKAFAFPYNDDKVEQGFFSEVFDSSLLEVSFGTSGLVSHFHPRNIQRVSMEKSDTKRRSLPASRILARQFVRATYFRMRRR